MIPIPSRLLVWWVVVAAAGSFAVLIFPDAWLLVLAFDLILAGAALLDWLLTPGPGSLTAERLTPNRMSVLADQKVPIVVRNRSRVGLHFRMRDTLPESLKSSIEELSGVVPAGGELRLDYAVTPQARGALAWGDIGLRYRSLLGLWERQKHVGAKASSRVYPSLVALERYHLLARANRLETLGIRKVRTRGSAWEFESLREYAQGDDIRLIDWKATARRHKTIVKNQEAERNQTVLLLIDCGRLMNSEVNGVAKLDYAVNASLILSHISLSRGDRVGLCSFSHIVHSWVTPRPNRGQIRLLTDALYDLRGDFTETDHGLCFRTLAARHPKRALLIVMTDFVDSETATEMVAHAQLAARRHVVLFCALKDPLLERAAHSRPASTFEAFRMASAVELLHERRQVLERLRQLGAHVIDAEPSQITAPLINGYLEIAFRGIL